MITKESPSFSQVELEDLIQVSTLLGDAFRTSRSLIAVGDGRADTMYQRMLSYSCILVYVYEVNYGNPHKFLATEDFQNRYFLCHDLVFKNPVAMRQCLAQLASNWQDVLTVVHALDLSGESVSGIITMGGLERLTNAFNKLSENC